MESPIDDARYIVARTGTWPLVVAWPISKEQWAINCPYCSQQHTHGAGPGHRVAHCSIVNEHMQKGYWLTSNASLAGHYVVDKPQ